MQLHYYSPMPPAASGVADYSAELLPYLRSLGPVEVNPQADGPHDAALYHIGNNQLHREIYDRAMREPGVVVLHDAVLQHFYLGMLNQSGYEDEFAFNYGNAMRPLARQMWDQRARSGSDDRYFAYPMLKRIVHSARAVIVHNPAAAEMVRRHSKPGTIVVEIPHLFVAPAQPTADQTKQVRAELGLTPATMLIATFGHQRETKRPAAILRAFHAALEQGVDAKLLFSGAFVSSMFEQTLAPLLDHPRVIRTGYLDEAAFWRYAAATDLCVNLRYPSASESSGIAVRLMGIGKPVAFSNDPAIARIPENACLRVDTGPAEEPMLTDYIVWLSRNREQAVQLGMAAAGHIAAHHAPAQVARAYWDVIQTSVA